MPLTPKEIGRRIREVAEEVGVGRAEIAQALGVDEATISKLEMGTLEPIPGDYILVIARLLKTDFRYFISSDLDDVEAETKKLFRKLAAPTPSDFLAIRRFVSFCMSEKDLEALLSSPTTSAPNTPVTCGPTNSPPFTNDKRSGSPTHLANDHYRSRKPKPYSRCASIHPAYAETDR